MLSPHQAELLITDSTFRFRCAARMPPDVQLGFLLAVFRLVCRTRPDVARSVVFLNVGLVGTRGFFDMRSRLSSGIFRSVITPRRCVASPLAFIRGFDLDALRRRFARGSWIEDDHSTDFACDLVTDDLKPVNRGSRGGFVEPGLDDAGPYLGTL
jgi:hypothetical protein